MERNYVVGFLAMLFVLFSSMQASSTEMCDPAEPPVVCAIIEQRNNAMSELAVAEGNRRAEVKKREAEAIYWKQYTNGLLNETELRANIEKVCAWKGMQNEPTVQLCKWWDTNYVAHPPAAKGVKK